jgi:hypothetical protein
MCRYENFYYSKSGRILIPATTHLLNIFFEGVFVEITGIIVVVILRGAMLNYLRWP